MKQGSEQKKKRNPRQFDPGQYSLTEQKVNQIINATSNIRDKCIIKCLFWGGMRRDEVRQFQIPYIHFDTQTIDIKGKYDKIRTIPALNMDFLTDLKHYVGNRKDGFVFLSNKEKAMTNRNINRLVAELGEKANIKNPDPYRKTINPHLFRHSIARWLKDKGYYTEFVQNFLGHESFKTTYDTYGKMGLEDMKKEVKRVTGENDR